MDLHGVGGLAGSIRDQSMGRGSISYPLSECMCSCGVDSLRAPKKIAKVEAPYILASKTQHYMVQSLHLGVSLLFSRPSSCRSRLMS